mgnify:CR=1 FL=1
MSWEIDELKSKLCCFEWMKPIFIKSKKWFQKIDA